MSEQVITTPSRWQRFKQSDFLYFFRKDKVAMVSFAIFMAFATMAVFAPFIAPTNPYDLSSIDIMDAELPPSWMDEGDERFTLGTDDQGRDIFSTILYGSRLSLTIGLLAVGLQLILGVIIGLSAGYFGGRIDNFLMRIADVQLSFSTMMVAIIISAIFRTALGSELYAQYAVVMLVVIIGIAEWPQYARTIRASVLAEKKKNMLKRQKLWALELLVLCFVIFFLTVYRQF